MALVLQLCAGVDGRPKRVDYPSFVEFADELRSPETVSDKLVALTLLPATLVDQEGKKELSNVSHVTALALDFDAVSEDQLLHLFKADLLGLRWVAHTTFSHPEEARTTGLQRWRVWLELSAPVPADQWRPFRELVDANLSVNPDIGQDTKNPNRLMFAPCTRPGEESDFEAFDWRDFPGWESATPLEVPTTLPTRTAAIPNVSEAVEPSGGVTPSDLIELSRKMKRRVSPWDKKVGAWVSACAVGEAYVTEHSHEPTLDLARVLADELPDVSSTALAMVVAPSLEVMRDKHGSDETEDGFAEKVRSWRKKRAAEKARIAPLLAIFGNTPSAQADGEDEHVLTPQGVLDSRFALFEHTSGVQVTYEVSPNGVCVRQETDARMVEALVRTLPCDEEGKPLTSRKARIKIDDWKPFSRRLPYEPEPSRFLSDPGACLQRLPFDLTPGPTPAWDEFTKRLSSPDLFKAFIWTGFEKRNRGRQVLWVKGEGEDGKSTALGVIREALGVAATAANAALFANRFGMSALDGKRFAIVFDCKDTKLLMNESLRNVTSGDEVLVEYKGEALETKRLNVKLIIGSNYLPDLTSSRADTSRLILLTVDKSASTDDPTWDGRLRAELPAFLAACKETYERLCPHHGKLPLSADDVAAVTERADAYEEEFSDTADDFLTITGNQEDSTACGPVYKCLTGRGMTGRNWPQGKYEAFKIYLSRRGVRTQRTSTGHVFRGAKAKSRGNVQAFEGKK